jgi:dienelactone hydrolase
VCGIAVVSDTGSPVRFRFVRTVAQLVMGALDGFVLGFAAAYVVATAASGVGRHLGFGTLGDVLVELVAVVAAIGLAWGLLIGATVVAGWIHRRLASALDRPRLPRAIRFVVLLPFRVIAAVPRTVTLMAALLFIVFVAAPAGVGKLVAPDGVLAPFLWYAAFAGAGLGFARAVLRRVPRLPRLPRALLAGAGMAVAAGFAVYGMGTFVDPGSDGYLVRSSPALDGTRDVDAPADPGATGPYAVTSFTYGSGTDRRAAFGATVLLRTPTVDASALLPEIGGGVDEALELMLGFGTDELPLNGRAWVPQGDGPFPLVLVVHGNHAMGAPSEAGYAYLGEHLASRGFIVASIDESFLNGSWAGDYKGSEQLVRAWLLLLHADQWRTWNADPASPVAGRVDMDRLALAGHSRGGEAAAVAASLARLDGSFNPLLRPWPEGLRVRSVVAIAPSDGQVGSDVKLDGMDLLEITGGHDADARAWSGIRQYNRTTVDEGGFKAAVYAYRSNHGQFNTVWGRGDQGPWSGALLNLRPLPTAAEQEDVARTAIAAFLEASLHGDEAYRAFFRRPMAGRSWLPEDVYLVRSDDGTSTPLVDAGRAGGPALTGITIVRERLAGSRSAMLPLRALQDGQGGKAVRLEWDAGDGSAAWGVAGLARAENGPRLSDRAELRMELGNTTDPGDPAAGPLDPIVEATTTDGVTVALPLSTWGALPPPLVTRLVKSDLSATLAGVSGLDLSLRLPAEQVVQSYAIPLADFAMADPAFVPERLDAVVLRIPRSTAGGLAVAGFGVSPAP